MLFKTNPALAWGLLLFSLTMFLKQFVGLPHWLVPVLLVAVAILELTGVVHYRRSLARQDKRNEQQIP